MNNLEDTDNNKIKNICPSLHILYQKKAKNAVKTSNANLNIRLFAQIYFYSWNSQYGCSNHKNCYYLYPNICRSSWNIKECYQ